MLDSISEVVLAITADMNDLGRTLDKARPSSLPDLEAAEGLIALVKIQSQARKTALRIKAALAAGGPGPTLPFGEQTDGPGAPAG